MELRALGKLFPEREESSPRHFEAISAPPNRWGPGRLAASESLAAPEIAGVPLDLRTWIAPGELASWIIEEVEAADSGTFAPSNSFGQPAENSFKMLLRLISFAYAAGVFSSTEIAHTCRTDKLFVSLSGNQFPFRQELTRLRRRHREVLATILSRLFRRSVSKRFNLEYEEIGPEWDSPLRSLAVQRLDIARHMDRADD